MKELLQKAFEAGVNCEFGGAPCFEEWYKTIEPCTEFIPDYESILDTCLNCGKEKHQHN